MGPFASPTPIDSLFTELWGPDGYGFRRFASEVWRIAASSMEGPCKPLRTTSGRRSERFVRVQAGGRNAINSPYTTVSGVPLGRLRGYPELPRRTEE